MAERTVNKKGEPIILSISNLVQQGGSAFVFDLRLQAPGIAGMAIVNSVTGHAYVADELGDQASSKRFNRVRVGTPRPQFVFSRTKLVNATDVVARREISVELDLHSRPPRLVNANADIYLR